MPSASQGPPPTPRGRPADRAGPARTAEPISGVLSKSHGPSESSTGTLGDVKAGRRAVQSPSPELEYVTVGRESPDWKSLSPQLSDEDGVRSVASTMSGTSSSPVSACSPH